MTFTDTLNGREFRNSQFEFRSTRRMNDATMEVEILDVPLYAPSGMAMDPRMYDFCGPRSMDGDSALAWCDSGYFHYVPEAYWVTMAHEVSWYDPEHPGRWFFYAKSIKTRPQGSQWWFGNPSELPRNPAVGGYRAQ